jgi:hypothetical protein
MLDARSMEWSRMKIARVKTCDICGVPNTNYKK